MTTCGAKRHLRPQVLATASEASQRREKRYRRTALQLLFFFTNNHQVYSIEFAILF
jgi:hypothetical protein